MATKMLAGQEVEVDPEGFLVDASQWNEDMARAMAKEDGIDELTDKHMQVIFSFHTIPFSPFSPFSRRHSHHGDAILTDSRRLPSRGHFHTSTFAWAPSIHIGPMITLSVLNNRITILYTNLSAIISVR